MLIGYSRVSTEDQSLNLQNDALRKAGCRHLFSDKLSGSTRDRPGLTKALAACKKGDTLVVWKLDRLGRSLPHLIETVRALEARGVGFQSLTERLDTTTAGGEAYLQRLRCFGRVRARFDPRTNQGGSGFCP